MMTTSIPSALPLETAQERLLDQLLLRTVDVWRVESMSLKRFDEMTCEVAVTARAAGNWPDGNGVRTTLLRFVRSDQEWRLTP